MEYEQHALRAESDIEAIGAPGSPRFITPFFACYITHSSRVLDVGVGYGRHAIPLALETSASIVVGLDVGRTILYRALKNALETKALSRLDLVRGDATRMPFRESSFHMTYSLATLYTLYKWRTAVAEMARVLRPHGIFIGDFRGLHLRNIVRNLILRVQRFLRLNWPIKLTIPYHLYSRRKMVSILDKMGLDCIQVINRKYRFLIIACKSIHPRPFKPIC